MSLPAKSVDYLNEVFFDSKLDGPTVRALKRAARELTWEDLWRERLVWEETLAVAEKQDRGNRPPPQASKPKTKGPPVRSKRHSA
jgi:hypothetical protein